jgi:hypothetical protein
MGIGIGLLVTIQLSALRVERLLQPQVSLCASAFLVADFMEVPSNSTKGTPLLKATAYQEVSSIWRWAGDRFVPPAFSRPRLLSPFLL